MVLFFYPAALTRGCTKESCHFRDLRSEFDALGAQPVGVSADTVKKQKQFDERYRLGFLLLSDPDFSVARLYGTKRAVSFLRDRRTTFVIGTDQRILDIFHSELAFEAHAERALRVLKGSSDSRAD